jgi:hypothetical protein
MAPPKRSTDTPNGPAPDLTAIDGIGPAAAKRLHAAGITSVGDLAHHTAQRVAAMLGPDNRITARRIRDENWIGQARKLDIANLQPADTEQHYLTFHVEFLVGPDEQVRRTQVRHYQTDTVEQWAGWDPTQLATYFNRHLADRPPAVEPEPDPPTVSFHTLGPSDQGTPRSFLHEDDPLPVHLDFTVHTIDELDTNRYDYTVAVQARTVGQPDRIPIGTTHGTGSLKRQIAVDWPDITLPSGLHFFEAELRLYPHNHSDDEPIAQHRHRGALIHVTPPRQVHTDVRRPVAARIELPTIHFPRK